MILDTVNGGELIHDARADTDITVLTLLAHLGTVEATELLWKQSLMRQDKGHLQRGGRRNAGAHR